MDDIIRTENDLVEKNFMPPYPNANQWSTTHHMEMRTFNPTYLAAADDSSPLTFDTMEQTHVLDTNFQKELLSEFEQDSKIKFQKYSKFLADKKALITLIFG